MPGVGWTNNRYLLNEWNEWKKQDNYSEEQEKQRPQNRRHCGDKASSGGRPSWQPEKTWNVSGVQLSAQRKQARVMWAVRASGKRRPRTAETWEITQDDSGGFNSAPSENREGRGLPLAWPWDDRVRAGTSMPFRYLFLMETNDCPSGRLEEV